MSNLIDLPPSDDEEIESRSSAIRKIVLRGGIGLFIAVVFTFSLAGTINIGGDGEFELGNRSFDVGTCASGTVQVIPKTTIDDSVTVLSQFTVTGINPVTCDGRIIKILPFDTNSQPIAIIDASDPSGVADQPFVEVFVSGGEFRASLGGSVETATVSTLTRTNGSASIRSSTAFLGSSTVNVYSGGQGRTLKSTDNQLEKLPISFQIRFSPTVTITGYGRTDLELRT